MHPETKVCSKCGEEHERNKFGKDSSKKDGLFVWCKKCASKQSSKWQRENREKQKDIQKRYLERNKEKLKISKNKNNEKQKILRKLNPEKYKKIFSEYKKTQTEKLSDCYVKQLLLMKDASPEIINMKRDSVIIKRLTKQLKKELQNV